MEWRDGIHGIILYMMKVADEHLLIRLNLKIAFS